MTQQEILDTIVQQTGVDILDMYELNPERCEKLLIYSGNIRICVGFNGEHDQDYYASAAWSCGCECYIVFNEEEMSLYTTVAKDVQKIRLDVAFRDFNLIFSYVKKYLISKDIRCFDYLCNKYLEMIKRFGTTGDVEPLLAFSCIWTDSRDELKQEEKSYLDEIKNGFDTYGLHIKPIDCLVRRFIAPSLIDVLGCLFYDRGDMVENLDKARVNGFMALSKMFIPDYVVRNCVHNRLNCLVDKPSITILDPFMWGVSPILETVKELFAIGYAGNIKVIGYSMGYEVKGLLDDIIINQKVTIEERQGPGFMVEWPNDCDLVLIYPPYKVLGSIYQNQELFNNLPEVARFNDIETLPIHFMERCVTAMADGARVFANIPLHLLHDEEFKPLRDRLYESLSIVHMEYIGDFVFSSSFIGSTSMIFAKNAEASQYVTCRCGVNSVDGYDSSVRESRKRITLSKNSDIVEYKIKSNLITTEDWSPKMQSDRILWDRLRKDKARQEGLITLDSVFYIRSGVVTGLNKAYIIDCWVYDALPVKEKKYFRPAVNGRTLFNGSILGEEFIFFPFGSDDKVFETEEELKEKVPFFYKHLLNFKDNLIEKRKEKDNPWWKPAICSSDNIPVRKKFVSLQIGRKGSISLDMEGVSVQTGGYIWIPKVKASLTDDMLFAYHAIFSSDYFWKIIGLYLPYTYTVDGQTYKLTKNVLDKIMIPNLKTVDKELVLQLSAMGYAILKEGLIHGMFGELEYIVRNLYSDGTY